MRRNDFVPANPETVDAIMQAVREMYDDNPGLPSSLTVQQTQHQTRCTKCGKRFNTCKCGRTVW